MRAVAPTAARAACENSEGQARGSRCHAVFSSRCPMTLLAMGIFSIVFGSRGLTTAGVPYSLFVVSGLVPWFYFSNATSGASVA